MYRKIVRYFIMILILCVGIISIRIYSTAKREYHIFIEAALQEQAQSIVEEIRQGGSLEEDIDIFHFPVISDSRLTIVDTSGEVIYETKAHKEALDNHKSRLEIRGALDGEIESSIRYSSTLNMDMIYVAVPITIDGSIVGAVRMSFPLNLIDQMTNQVLVDILITMAITVLVGIVAFYIVTKNIIRPLNETIKFAQEIAEGSYHKRLSGIRKDEIGSLNKSLNHMAKQLEYSFKKLAERNLQLESVLTNIKSGIIVINEREEILIINDTAIDFLSSKDKQTYVGKSFLEAIRTYEIYSGVQQSNEKDEVVSFEIEKDASNYSIYIKPNIYDHGTKKSSLIVIDDVTKIKKLESLRKDFVANVTHELKTPITAIKGFVETLLAGEVKKEETRNRFYSIMETEIDRLTYLVDDILILSSLDNKKTFSKQEKEIVDIRCIMETIISLMANIAQSKDVRIKLSIDEQVKTINFNPDQFKQMMINILDNAIKYNKYKGYVNISIYLKDTWTIIEIQDSGIGIPQKDIDRLFERFYRVDKGRSRQAGGTGLGLAIVKHILQLHGANIQVQSKLGKGASFIITIP